MIIDAPILDRYDVVVIGTGPAGITAALRIAEQSSASVALIESGTTSYDEKIHQLSNLTGGGDLGAGHFAFHAQRVLGGTSNVWGGWCAALERRAFTMAEWPIDYDEIDRYYPEAAEILEVSRNAYLYKEATIEGCPNLVYKPFYQTNAVRFQAKYEATLEEHPTIHLILGKTCTRLEREDEIVTEAVLMDSLAPENGELSIKADQFVMACGGVGNARLLQLSEIAQNSPVGRHLMEHPHLHGVCKVYLDEERIKQYMPDDNQLVHALQLSTEHCLEHDVLSFSASFHIDETAERLILGRQRTVIEADVVIRAEMVPDYENRISLGDELDALGQPRGDVSFYFNYDDLARRSWQLFSDALLTSGLGRPGTMAPELVVGGGGHYIGTTRMGTSEFESVVDGNCKVHSTANLYVAGSSIFPAGGVANPTYTIVAMSLRLADHLAGLTEGD